MRKIKIVIRFIAISLIVGLLIYPPIRSLVSQTWGDGYVSGYKDGSKWAFDTLNDVMRHHIDSTSKVAEVHIESADTVVYYLQIKSPHKQQ